MVNDSDIGACDLWGRDAADEMSALAIAANFKKEIVGWTGRLCSCAPDADSLPDRRDPGPGGWRVCHYCVGAALLEVGRVDFGLGQRCMAGDPDYRHCHAFFIP